MSSLSKRVSNLEGGTVISPIKPFLWHHGEALTDALASAGLALGDEGLMAIRLVGVSPGGGTMFDPVYERDRRLIDGPSVESRPVPPQGCPKS